MTLEFFHICPLYLYTVKPIVRIDNQKCPIGINFFISTTKTFPA